MNCLIEARNNLQFSWGAQRAGAPHPSLQFQGLSPRWFSQFHFQGPWFACLILLSQRVQGSLSIAKHRSFARRSLKIGCRVAQLIKFTDGWGNPILKWTTLHPISSSVCDGWRCSNLTYLAILLITGVTPGYVFQLMHRDNACMDKCHNAIDNVTFLRGLKHNLSFLKGSGQSTFGIQ